MQDLKNEIKSRFSRVDILIKHIWKLETELDNNNALLALQKATIYLMLYNIVEYSVVMGIENIFSEFEQYDIKNFTHKIQSHFLLWFCRNNYICQNNTMETIILSWENEHAWGDGKIFSKRILNHGYKKLKLHEKFKITNDENIKPEQISIKGNIWSKEINLILKFFEIKSNFTEDECEKLNYIRDQRNKLWHGWVSFEDCWRGLEINSIKEHTKKVKSAIKKYITKIEKYVNEKTFLRFSTPTH